MAVNDHIISTIAVLETPKLKTVRTQLNTFPVSDMLADVERYWSGVDKSGKRRKLFLFEFWQLLALMEKTGSVMLAVHQINDPYKVNGGWKSFDPAKPPTKKTNSRWFVLNKNSLVGNIEELSDKDESFTTRGLATVQSLGMNSNFVVGLIGKKADRTYVAYICNAGLQLILEDPDGQDTQPGGEGASGLKLPG